ncbi:M23 family metallopeptidase [Arsukibacterium sp.]|uniref:M23 family metallopeptidase n=1 Tax=Arsukibacterium sp. TaxID=1977258 RepID=UPI002FDA7B04
MKAWVKALLLLASGCSAAVASATVTLEGELTQGSLILGQAPVGAKVWFNQQALSVSEDGRFVFGIGRDAPLEHQLRIKVNNTEHQRALRFQARDYDIQRINGVEQKYVSPPAEVTARIARDNQRVRAARQQFSPLPASVPAFFAQPVRPAQGRISGVYGSQRIFNGQPRNPHFGLDIAAPVGAPVLAPWAGRVTLAEDLYFSGLTLIVDHGLGVSSTFMHLSAFNVAVGDVITPGQKIAEIGASGRVTGPHLDWRINWLQERLDPQLLMPEFSERPVTRLSL